MKADHNTNLNINSRQNPTWNSKRNSDYLRETYCTLILAVQTIFQKHITFRFSIIWQYAGFLTKKKNIFNCKFIYFLNLFNTVSLFNTSYRHRLPVRGIQELTLRRRHSRLSLSSRVREGFRLDLCQFMRDTETDFIFGVCIYMACLVRREHKSQITSLKYVYAKWTSIPAYVDLL